MNRNNFCEINANQDVDYVNENKNEEVAQKLLEGEEIAISPSGDASGKEQGTVKIEKGIFAVDPYKSRKEIAKEIAKKLREGQKITFDLNGDATGKEPETVKIAKGVFAVDPSKLRKETAKKLREGQEITVGSSGDATGKEQGTVKIERGKLAAQWHQLHPEILKAEKEGMKKFFPHFKLGVYNDPNSHYNGCLYWRGTLKPGMMKDMKWDVMAIYMPNHPQAMMGSSVHVYLIDPTLRQVRDALGCWPHHVLTDQDGSHYLCTTRAEDISVNGDYVTTAVQSIGWACKWLIALELVMTGDLSVEQFNNNNGI